MNEILKAIKKGYYVRFHYKPFDGELVVTVWHRNHSEVVRKCLSEMEIVEANFDIIGMTVKECADILENQIRKLERGL